MATSNKGLTTDKLRNKLKGELSTPSIDPVSGTKQALITWIVMLFNFALTFIHQVNIEIFSAITDGDNEADIRRQALDARITALERESAAVATTRSKTKATAAARKPTASTSKAAPVPMARTPADQDSDYEEPPYMLNPVPAHAQRKTTMSRCKTCHAQGHDKLKCRSTNPAATRKRVALNQRRKKEARCPPPVSYPLAAPTSSFATFAPPLTAPDPRAFAALAADAQELRRRQQQSNRDKRRAHRSAVPTTL